MKWKSMERTEEVYRTVIEDMRQKPPSSSSPISLHPPHLWGTGPAVPAGHLAPKPEWNTGPNATISFCTA